MSDQQEIQELQAEVRALRERLDQLSQRLAALTAPAAPAAPPPLPRPAEPAPAPAAVAVAEPGPSPVIPAPAAAIPPVIAPPAPPPPVVARESFEVRLGTFWLPRIGMMFLLIGMAFFAAYYFPRLNPVQKLAGGYAGCAVLCGLGLWLEQRMQHLARVLFAGGLALTYFLTYAAYQLPAVRVIENATVGVGLLAVVVGAIIVIAQRRQSAVLAGLALFFGYVTTLVSQVAAFTLAANALLAVAALFFLWRNHWVPISYLAVFGTYLTYMLWVWRLNLGGELGDLIFERGYLEPAEFRLRAVFLGLYWLLFTAGGLLARRDALEAAERRGLLTLNNALFFILFALLMHHAWPERQWVFLFVFGGALLVSSAAAYRRLAPERGTMELLFLQGIIVATLGLLDYFREVHLVAALALESLFLLWLARAIRSRGVAWLGRAAYLGAVLVAWAALPGWTAAMLWAGWLTAAIGLGSARLERAGLPASLSYAVLATLLALTAAREQFAAATLPWAWLGGAILLAVLGGGLRTRAVVWAAHLPLAWALWHFLLAALAGRFWPLDQSLALIAGLFGFGVVARVWSAAQVWPYACAAIIAVINTTHEYCPARWQLTVSAAETAVLVGAGIWTREKVFAGLGLAIAVIGFLGYLGGGAAAFAARPVAWANLAGGLVLLGIAGGLLQRRGAAGGWQEQTGQRLGAILVGVMTAAAIFAVLQLVDAPLRSVGWALAGLVFLVVGFVVRTRAYRLGGLVAIGFALARVIIHDFGQFSTPYRILSSLALGVILLLLAYLYTRNREKLARWL